MLYYSLNAFDKPAGIERLVVAVPASAMEMIGEHIRAWGFSRPVSLVPGGARRSDSVLAALRALPHDPPDIVLIHDAARPCLTPDMVDALLKSADTTTVATLAYRASDTLRIVENDYLSGEIDRDTVACLETPQMFPYARLLELHESARDLAELTDDTALFARAGEKVRVVFHDGTNLKVTYPEDVAAAEGILFVRGWEDASEGGD
jgi:2-C-methyl-D-erythritol 4-phosphate cytidylyltransferase